MSEVPSCRAVADAVAEIEEFGSTVLRNAWRREDLDVILSAITRFTAHRAERIASGRAPPHEKMMHTHGAGGFADLVAEGFLDASILAKMFVGSPYHDLCREYFDDDEFYVQPTRLLFRNHDPQTSDRSFVPYHQDSGSQDPRVQRILNCWIPLDPGAGSEAPGLEVVRSPGAPKFPIKDFGLKTENAVYDFITIDRDRIVEEYGSDQFLAPRFEVGDGFAFSQDVIHRTYVAPDMTRPRRNFEFRVFSPKHVAPGAARNAVLQNALRVA